MKMLTLLGIFIFSFAAFAMNGRTTYQAKIVKPDGYPLESASVNFKFTVLDAAASCVLYSENYSAVDMRSTGGLISFALGNGVRDFPASGTTAVFSNVFDNSINSMPCQTPGIYNPLPNDTRRIVMQFNDGNGWQTLPAMTINTVPYAMYANKSNDSKTLNGKADTAFVENSTLAALNCNPATHAITFNGVSFSCIPVGSSSSGITSVTTSGTVLTTGGTASAPVISIKAVTMSQDGYLTSLDYAEFKAKLAASSTQIVNTLGYAPVSGAAVTTQINNSNLSGDVSGTISSNSVVSVGGKTAAQISTSVNDTLAATSSATVNTIVKRDSSGNSSFSGLSANTASLNYVDIYRPSTSFNIRLQAPTSLSTNYVLNLPTTSGTTGQVLSTDGSGNLSWINPSTGSVVSVSATAPLASTGGSNPILSITQANSTTNGYLSSTDWNTFNNKQAATSAAIIATLGYTPADNAASGTYLQKANNLSDLASVATARTNLGLGSLAVGNSIDLGSASATGIIADARLLNQSNVISGTQYTKVTVDGKGRVTSGAQLSSSDVTTALGYTPANSTSGIISFNGSTSQTQTFANGATGTQPSYTTANGVHTLNIPFASVGTTTAGLISNTDYTTFTNKITSSAVSIAQVLGYTPADNAASGTFLQKANNLSDLTNASIARTNLGLGSLAVGNSIDLGSASATGTLATARIPAFTGDATIAAASTTILLSNSGVTAGIYTKVTVDAKGRVTSSSSLALSDVTTALGYTPASATAASQWMTSGSTISYVAGNVGIGINSPSNALSVSGIIQTTGGIKFPDGSIQTTAASGAAAVQSSVWFFVADATYNTPAATANLVITMGKQYTSGSSNFNPSVTQAGHTSGVNGFDKVNGRFIPPVAGRYYFQAQASASMANGFVAISKNGTIISQAMMYGYASNMSWMSGNASVILDLITSDIITFTYYATNGLTIGQTYNYQINGFLLPSQSVVDAKYVLGTPADADKILKLSTDGQTITKSLNLTESVSGSIGIGTSTPVTKLDVSGGVRIGTETTTCAASLAGTLRYNASNVEYCNGTSWQAFGISGSGIANINGSTSGTQSFATGTTGTAPGFATTNGVHTLNIPLASVGSVTAGLLSNADYTTFTNKITSSAASIAQVLGYTPASATSLSSYVLRANNLSDLTSSATARTNLGLGTFATASSIDLGSASATGTMAAARMPELQGDVDSVSGSVITTVVGLQGRSVASIAPASGQVLAYNGTSWAPGTSISSQWSTSGSTINYSSGNVGIGTTTPAYKLSVYEAVASVVANIESGSNGSAVYTRATGKTSGGVTRTYGAGVNISDSNGNYEIYDFTAGASRLYMNSSGNIGIGTTSPSWKFQIKDQYPYLAFQDTDNASGSIGTITYNQDGNFYFDADNPNTGMDSGYHFRANGATKYLMSIKNNGNIGIGTTTPDKQLTMHSTGLDNYIHLTSSMTGTTAADGVMIGTGTAGDAAFYNRENTNMIFLTNNTERVRIGNTGNVGIGTTNPSGVLHVNGAGWGDQTVAPDTSTFPVSGSTGVIIDGSYNDGRYRTRLAKVDRSGNLPLYIQQTKDVANTYTNLARFGEHSQSTNVFEVYGNTSISGNVGIGTSAPTARLEVAGEIKFGNSSSACNSSNEGQQRYNSTSKSMEFCNGTAWTSMGGSGLGYGQTWQNVAASRTWSTNYTNGTGKPIVVQIGVVNSGAADTTSTQAYVDGVMVVYSGEQSNRRSTYSFIVPAGSTYNLTYSTTGGPVSIAFWSELR